MNTTMYRRRWVTATFADMCLAAAGNVTAARAAVASRGDSGGTAPSEFTDPMRHAQIPLVAAAAGRRWYLLNSFCASRMGVSAC
jgi:hypothetical protein